MKLTLRALAKAAGIGKSTLQTIIVTDCWPKRHSRDAVQSRLREAVRKAGATEEQLAGLFLRSEPIARQFKSTVVLKHYIEEEPEVLLPKQTLRQTARKAFKLFNNPFDGEVFSEDAMFTSPEIAYVRESCMQAAMGHRFVAIVGESGAGKTTVLGDLEARILRERKPVQFIRPWVLGMEDTDAKGKTLKSTDILASIITTLNPMVTVPQTIQARSTVAKALLTESSQTGTFNLLVIEEAHCLPDSTMKHLKRLHEMRLGMRPLLGILLVGQTELAQRLDSRRAALREVTQRCEMVHLLPLDGDLHNYLAHRARTVDRPLSDFIDASGIDEIRARLTITRPGTAGKPQKVSLAYPLAVNNLITAAMNAAADIGAPFVTKDLVRAV
ncbi:MAG: AAA family ATPase [Burkholderiaceae bacterium]